MSMTWQEINDTLKIVFANASNRGDKDEAKRIANVLEALREKEAEAGSSGNSKADKLARISAVADTLGSINF